MIGRPCAGIDEARLAVDSWARYIADQIVRGADVSEYAVGRYRDACTDLRDMYATNDDVLEARALVGAP